MVELESEGEMTRSEVAAFLREFASELDDGSVGGDMEFVDDEELDGETLDEQQAEHREEFVDDRDDFDDETFGGDGQRREEGAEGDSLDAKRITLIVGGDSATVTVPNTMEFDVEVESRSPMFSSGVNQEIEFELSWEIEDPDEIGDDRIEVE